MNWRRLLPLLLLLLNAWVAMVFLSSATEGISMLLFASLTVVGVFAALTVRREPKELEQNILGTALIAILAAGLAVTALARLGAQAPSRAELPLFAAWAVLSGFTAARFWAVPPSREWDRDKRAETMATGARYGEKERGPT